MKIQFNSDKTIEGSEKHEDYFSSVVENGLKRFEDHISRVEVHLSDQNGSKKGVNDIRCKLEARVEGRQPTTVTCDADTVKDAVSGATDKLKAALQTIIGRSRNR